MASGLKSSCPGSRTVVEPYARGAPSALPARAVYLDGQRCRQGPCHVASNFLKAALVEHAQPEYAHSCTPLRTRRGVLAALLSAGLAVGMPQPAEAAATASPGKGPAGEGARVPLSVEALPGRSATPSPVLLHSKRSEVPCSLTIRNSSGRAVEALWVNYDGDEEPYTLIPPGHQWTVDTYETHPWRLRDARTGSLLLTYVAEEGQRLLQVPAGVGAAAEEAPESQRFHGENDTGEVGYGAGMDDVDGQVGMDAEATQPGLAGGFDGLGSPESQYTRAELDSVAVVPAAEEAVVVLSLEGYARPLSLLVGLPEARAVVNAAGATRGRRPGTLSTWGNTLKALGGTVRRVVITRQVGGIFYARIVLEAPPLRDPSVPPTTPPSTELGGRGPWSSRRPLSAPVGPSQAPGPRIVSVDSRPSDALALALTTGVEVFVSIPVAELVQRQYEAAERDLPGLLLPDPDEPEMEGEGLWPGLGGFLGA